MRVVRGNSLTLPVVAPPLAPEPPEWAVALAGGPVILDADDGARGLRMGSRHGAAYTLISVALPDVADESADAFADAVASVYRAIAAELLWKQRHAVRIWNFVPDIQGPIAGAGDRYMAFNLGRFAAYCDWFGGPDTFRATLPTSSAVGVADPIVWVHVLAADAPGHAIENPRQVPAYLYSRRYGVRPPCFARATRVDDQLLIGGTASILGEASNHVGDVEAQTRETFDNIAALIESANGAPLAQPLERVRSLRVHVRDADHAAAVGVMLDDLALPTADIELVQAPLCRKELLVEIEGVAEC